MVNIRCFLLLCHSAVRHMPRTPHVRYVTALWNATPTPTMEVLTALVKITTEATGSSILTYWKLRYGILQIHKSKVQTCFSTLYTNNTNYNSRHYESWGNGEETPRSVQWLRCVWCDHVLTMRHFLHNASQLLQIYCTVRENMLHKL
jgi:hypothetical protein